MYPAPACRLKRMYSAHPRSFKPVLFIIYIIMWLLFLSLFSVYPLLGAAVKDFPGRIIAYCRKDPVEVFKKAMPVLEWSSFEDDTAGLQISREFWNTVAAFVRVDLCGAAAVLRSQIPLLAAVEFPEAEAVQATRSEVSPVTVMPGEKVLAPPPGEETLVCIYNTHTGETYSLTDDVERLDGGRGGVVAVAAAVEKTLADKYGIKVARSDKINDADYSTSYVESEKTARELLAANPETKVLLDIHRDSEKTRKQSTVKVNGRAAAAILLVVGSDARGSFPGWGRNYDFAVKLSGKINEMYPGLCLGVRVKDGRYNQFLHPHAVLVEVGTTNNYTEEALRSAEYLADALAELLAS